MAGATECETAEQVGAWLVDGVTVICTVCVAEYAAPSKARNANASLPS